MALYLKDIRCKVHPVTFAFLEGEGRSRGVDKCVILREILDAWANANYMAHREAQRLLEAEGLAGAPAGISGQNGALGPGGLKWDDE